jgi:peptidoglycan/xylan/chitin deacetylase (PgdA/CDA1 family)
MRLNELPAYQKLLYKLFFVLRLPELARFWNRANITILCYHGITERSGIDSDDRSGIAVSRNLFLAQLTYITRRYTVISLSDYLAARRTGSRLPRHAMILTFDDGLRNFLTVAAPVLKELGLPATMFLVTDQIEHRDESSLGENWTPLDDRICLTWPEAKTLQSTQNIEFGSHTCSHPEIHELSANVDREFHDSLAAIRENLPNVISPSLAYPYGSYSELIVRKARSAGYSCALTTEAGANSNHTDLFQLRRSVVRCYDTTEIFAARVSGLVGWLRIAQEALRKWSLPLVRAWNSAFSQSPSN